MDSANRDFDSMISQVKADAEYERKFITIARTGEAALVAIAQRLANSDLFYRRQTAELAIDLCEALHPYSIKIMEWQKKQIDAMHGEGKTMKQINEDTPK